MFRPRPRHITVAAAAAAAMPIPATSRHNIAPTSISSISSRLSLPGLLTLILALCIMASSIQAASSPCPSTHPNCTYYWNYTLDPCNYPCAPYGVPPPVRVSHATCLSASTNQPASDTNLCIQQVGNVTQTNQPCNTQPCVRNNANVTGRPWTACSDNCPDASGPPTQTRHVADCVTTNVTGQPHIIVPDPYCPPVANGVETQTCNTQPCYWQYLNGTCSTTAANNCGPGNINIITRCTYNGINEAAASYCLGPQSPPVYSCSGPPCYTYSWSCPNFPSCVPGCADATQTRSCSCIQDPGSTTQADSLCVSANITRPSLTRTCPGEPQYCPTTATTTNPPTLSPCQLANCSSHGTCVPATASCTCDNGYWGAQCDQPPAIKYVSVTTATSTGTPDSVTVGTVLQIIVTTTANMNKISMWLTPSAGVPVYMNLSLTNKVGGGAYYYTIPHTLPPARYAVTVSFTAAITLSSTPFTVLDPCASINCKNGGTCAQGVCTCVAPWTGTVCDTVPACPSCGAHGSCVTSTGLCSCTDGYTGDSCQIPPTCTLSCQNGGHLNFASSCSCTCPNRWSGALCDQCGISASGECQSGGVPDALCQQCTCPVYNGYTWTGPTCSLAQRLISIPLSGTTDPALGTLLAQDIQAILGWASDRVKYYDVNQGAYRVVLISETSSAIDRAVAELNALLHPDPNVPPPNTPFTLSQGYASSKINPTTTITEASVPPVIPPTAPPTLLPTTPAPTNPPTPPASSGGSSFPTLYIYIAAAGGAVLIIIGIIVGCVCWRRHRQSYGFAENVTKLGASGVSIDIPKELQRGHGQTLANFELSPLATANPKYLASTQSNPAFSPPANTYQIPPPPPDQGRGESPWEPRQDQQGYQYWYNNQTGETSWESPY